METKDITKCFENEEQAKWIKTQFKTFLETQTPEFRVDAIEVAKNAYWTTQEDYGHSDKDTIGISSLVAKYGDQAKEFAKLLCIQVPYQGTLSSVRLAFR